MPAVDALLEVAGVGAGSEHALVVVGLEREHAAAAEGLAGLVGEDAGVGAVPQGVRELAVLVCGREAKAHRIRDVVAGGEDGHVHAAQLERVRVLDDLERQLREALARGDGAGRGKERAIEVVRKDRQAGDVVRVLVGEKDRPDVVHVDA